MTSKIREDSVAASVIGIDIGKEVFHLVGFSADGRLVLRQKIKRLALEATRVQTVINYNGPLFQCGY